MNVGSYVFFSQNGFNFGFSNSKVNIGGDFTSGGAVVDLSNGTTMTVKGNWKQTLSSMNLSSDSTLVVLKDFNSFAVGPNLQGSATVFGRFYNTNANFGGVTQISNLTTFGGF